MTKRGGRAKEPSEAPLAPATMERARDGNAREILSSATTGSTTWARRNTRDHLGGGRYTLCTSRATTAGAARWS